jgi:undecaprenyl-diphosphatase
MRDLWPRIAGWWRVELWLLVSVLAVGALLLAFGLIADEVVEGGSLAFDRKVVLAFRSATDLAVPIGPPWLQEAARDISALGSQSVLGIGLFAVAGYLFLAGKPAAAWTVLVAVIGGTVLNTLLKFGFDRPRPDMFVPAARVFTPSFPSGHAALSAITYLTLGALLARVHPSRPLRIYVMSLAVALTLLVGLSRIYLGVHYPTDVLAGWCVGSAWALACWAVAMRLQRRKDVVEPSVCGTAR